MTEREKETDIYIHRQRDKRAKEGKPAKEEDTH